MPAPLSLSVRPRIHRASRASRALGLGASACLTLAALAVPLATAPAHAAPASTSTSTSTAPTGWVATHTQGLTLRGTSLGAAPAGQRLHISVVLPMRHTDGIEARIESLSTPGSPDYGHFLSPAQVRAAYGPSAATVRDVRAYLAAQGFTGIAAAPNRLLVDATGSVAQVQRAFHTSIGRFSVPGQHRQVYANTTAASVPTAMSGEVVAVLGLSNLSMTLPHRVVSDSTEAGSPNLSGFTPRQIQKVYHATGLPAAKKSEIAVVASGDMTKIIKDLRYAETVEKFPKVPVNVVYTAPKEAIVHDNPLTGNAEWDLDVQISTMEAQNVKRLDIYDIATYTDSDVARAFNKFVTDDISRTLSASLGECDALAYADGAMITTDELLSQGALQGQSSFASTGDNGSFCPEGASTGVPGGGPGQSWPADGEYTAAVGGTTLVADDQGTTSAELAWIGGGGGISTFATPAPWTLQANTAGQAEEYNNEGGRGVPDIAAVADENTGVLIYTGDKDPSTIGGTSVSSPLVMGLWARINNAHHNTLGLASYRFYQLYNKTNPATVAPGLIPTYVANPNPQKVPGFRDITAGANGAYTAKPGYDYTTGVGTPLCNVLDHRL